jgi:hypothetical protein
MSKEFLQDVVNSPSSSESQVARAKAALALLDKPAAGPEVIAPVKVKKEEAAPPVTDPTDILLERFNTECLTDYIAKKKMQLYCGACKRSKDFTRCYGFHRTELGIRVKAVLECGHLFVSTMNEK